MLNLSKIDFRHSFATKVSLWMLATTAAVFLLSFGTALWFAGAGVLHEGHQKANLELDKAVLFLTNEMNAVEVAGNNLAASWDSDRKISTSSATTGTYKAYASLSPPMSTPNTRKVSPPIS